MRRSKNVGVAFVGLLVVAAISVAAGSGGKPPKEQGATVSLRPLSGSEVMAILRKFPEMVPSYLATHKDDGELLARLFGFSEVSAAPLKRVFPAARFYQGQGFTLPPYPYLMAVTGDKRYMMPDGYNRLLLDNGLEVTDKNVVELAEAFVIAAIADESRSLPGITFSGATRTKLKADLPTDDAAILKVKIGEQTEEWHFSVLRGQFEGAARVNEEGLIQNYPSVIVESLPGRGQLTPTPTPALTIGTYPDSGDAYLEHDTLNNAHYYIIVERNDDSTGNEVVFYLDSFPPESTNVCVRVRDSVRHATRWLDTVQMSSGSGSDTWQPRVESTGICLASAGYDVGGTYVRVTNNIELTPERLKTCSSPDDVNESLKVYFCDQFFPQNDTHASTFAQYVKDAMIESWQKQVDTWGLGVPPDSDQKHQVFVFDNQSLWYHHYRVYGPGWAEGGRNRMIGIQPNIWTVWCPQYSNENSAVKSAIAHEFYHGVEWGLLADTAKVRWSDSTWWWFTEGQARFLQSVQCESEEFLGASRMYPEAANDYLTVLLNWSVKDVWYEYCLFWRYMYENFGRNSGGVQLVKNCYAENVGTNNSISQGKLAIDLAMAQHGIGNFLAAIDTFAVHCYLNDTSFHLWDSARVYDHAARTVDTTFKLGPNEIDSIAISDSVPHSFGFDLAQLRLNGNVDTLLVRWRDTGAVATLLARLVKVYPRDSFYVDSTKVQSATKFHTHGADSVCLVITRHDTVDTANGPYEASFVVRRAVAVTELLPVTDTVIAGTQFTPKAVVANRGWMKETFFARYTIGTVYRDSQSITLDAGDSVNIQFKPWKTTKGSSPTCCWVYIAADKTRSDDTLRGSMVALADTWQTRPAVPESVSQGGALAAVGDTLIYAFRGGYSTHFFCYDVRSRTWTGKASLPTSVGHGSSLTWDRGAYIYALGGSTAGGRHHQLFRYDVAHNTWYQMPGYPPGDFGGASTLVWGDGHYLYAIQGLFPNNTQGFFRYDTSTKSWSLKQNLPAACSLGASLCWDLANSIYALRANLSKSFYRCDTNASTWFTKTGTPTFVAHGGALAYDSLDNGVYAWSGAFGGTNTAFWRYSTVGDSWSWRAYPPAKVGYGGALTSCAGFVYGLRGNGYTDFWRYAPRLPATMTRLALEEGVAGNSLGITSCRLAISPNPARGAVRVQWQVKEPGVVTLRVYDNAGRVVRTIQNGYEAAGRYSARWDGVCDNGRRAANGVFFYRLDAPGFHKIVKVAAVGR